MLGRLDEGEAVLEEVIPIAEATGDLRSLRLALNSLGWVHEAWGDFEQDAEYTERALQAAQRLGDPTVIAFMTSNRGGPAFNLGDWQRARADFETGLALMRPLGANWASAWPPLLLGRLDLAQGHGQAAASEMAEAIMLAERSQDLQALRWAHAALAEQELLEGSPATARERLSPLLDRPGQQESDVCALLPLLAWARLDLGEVAQAEALMEQAIVRAQAGRLRPALVSAWQVSALLLQRHSQWDQAQQHLEQALALSQELRHPYAQAKTLYWLGALNIRCGYGEQACVHLKAALAILAYLGERLYAERADAALLSI
jgi:tetratricopeptide (TPR) repeat protein